MHLHPFRHCTLSTQHFVIALSTLARNLNIMPAACAHTRHIVIKSACLTLRFVAAGGPERLQRGSEEAQVTQMGKETGARACSARGVGWAVRQFLNDGDVLPSAVCSRVHRGSARSQAEG